MSKSRGNVVSPRSIVSRLGADTARCYILFVGPPDQDADWSDSGVEGMHRFLGAALAPGRRDRAGDRAGAGPPATPGRRPRAAAQGALGDREGHRRARRPLCLQHRDRGRDGADQRLLPAAAPRSAPGALRFAVATAASLIFPFAPHAGADAYQLLTGRARLGGAVADRRPGAARARGVRARLPGQRPGPRPRDGAHRGERGGARRARAGGAERASRTSPARRSSGSSSWQGNSSTSSYGSELQSSRRRCQRPRCRMLSARSASTRRGQWWISRS